MKISYKVFILFAVLLALASASAVSFQSGGQKTLRDGYYTAEMENYHHGWKEFLTIYVNNGKIVFAEYDAKNASGLIKSWDMDYMRRMNKTDGNYPNKYTRKYAAELLIHQTPDGVDAMSGATESFVFFKTLADAAIRQALAGDKKVAFVRTPHIPR
ncbi:MAG: FMN-binding protein [Synergistaceae bacterium]|jgi:major membrane immunogen (membrane-anchored lipoprotein)|nr:FMN-binding protein [Synergistaceae bacterium]